MLGEGGGSRPGGRTGGSSHSTCEIEQHQGHDTALRPGLIHGATHSFIYGPERGGSCLRSHRKLVADQGKETRMEWNCVGGGGAEGARGHTEPSPGDVPILRFVTSQPHGRRETILDQQQGAVLWWDCG